MFTGIRKAHKAMLNVKSMLKDFSGSQAVSRAIFCCNTSVL